MYDTKLSVFVDSLPFDIETEALTRHFMQCGDVSNSTIIRDASTGLGKGFGFVLFEVNMESMHHSLYKQLLQSLHV